MEGWIHLFLAIVLTVLMIRAVWRDLACRTISNRLNLCVAAVAPITWWAESLPLWPGVALQIGVAALIFALFALSFALGMMGGGDVKLVTALALWRVPLAADEAMFAPILQLLVVMAIAGGVLTLFMVVRHRLRGAPGQPEIPYGVAIAVGTLATYAERYLNQWG